MQRAAQRTPRGPGRPPPVSSSSSGSPLSWGRDPCSSQRHQRDAEASPPGPWQTSPVSSKESPRGWDPDPAEPPNARSSWPPCIPPRPPQVADPSSPDPWQTTPVSSAESPLGWGPDPVEPPEASSSWPPRSPVRGRQDTEGSPPGAPWPWETSSISSAEWPLDWGPEPSEPHVGPSSWPLCIQPRPCWGPDPAEPPEAASSWQPPSPTRGGRDAEGSPPGAPWPWETSSVSLGEGSLDWGPEPSESPRPRRPQLLVSSPLSEGPVGGGAQPATSAASLAAADGPLAHLLRLFGRVSPELGRRHLGDPWGPLHSSEAPAGGRAQPTAGALADLPRLLRGVSSGLSCSSGLGLSRGSQLVSHHPHTSAAVARVQAGKARSGTDMA
ncbi:hypothetical protein R6Z07F_009327 [Ovis aries]